MDFSLIKAKRTLNTGLCLEILMDSQIFDAISEDGATVNDVRVNIFDEYWVEITNDDVVIGVAQFKPMFNKCFDAHIHILPEYRKTHSLDAGSALIEWCEEHLKGCLLFTTIPEFCPNVVSFLKSFGFKESGKLKGAWKKNGKQNDMTILTRGI